MICPKLPYFKFSNPGVVEINDSHEENPVWSLPFFEKGTWRKVRLYDVSGQLWRIAEATPARKIGRLESIISGLVTVRVPIKLRFELISCYVLEEMKEALIECVSHARGGVVDQFKEKDRLIEELRATSSFEECASIIHFGQTGENFRCEGFN